MKFSEKQWFRGCFYIHIFFRIDLKSVSKISIHLEVISKYHGLLLSQYPCSNFVRSLTSSHILPLGHAAWVEKDGSTFLKTLCKVLQSYRGQNHLQDVVTKVNELLAHDIYNWREKKFLIFTKKESSCEASETTHSMTYNIFFNDTKLVDDQVL